MRMRMRMRTPTTTTSVIVIVVPYPDACLPTPPRRRRQQQLPLGVVRLVLCLVGVVLLCFVRDCRLVLLQDVVVLHKRRTGWHNLPRHPSNKHSYMIYQEMHYKVRIDSIVDCSNRVFA